MIDAGLQLCALAAASRVDGLLPDHLFLPLGADRIVVHAVEDRRLRGLRVRAKRRLVIRWLPMCGSRRQRANRPP